MHIYIDSASLSTHLSTVMSTFWLLPLFMEPFYNMLGLQVATSPLLWNLLTSRWIFGNLAVNYRHSTCMCFIRIIMVGTIAIVSICGSVCCVGWLPWPSLHVNVGPMTLYASNETQSLVSLCGHSCSVFLHNYKMTRTFAPNVQWLCPWSTILVLLILEIYSEGPSDYSWGWQSLHWVREAS